MSRVIGILLALLAATAALATPASQAAATDSSVGTNTRAPGILVFGDSLSAGYGVPVGHDWVSLLAHKIGQQGYDFDVVNASVTGETSAGGLARLPRALQLHHPRILVLELGANDGLRGLPVARTQANLDRMIALAQSQGMQVLLLGIRLPPNYGPRYTSEFFMMYGQLAQTRHVALVPWLMARVALNPQLMQDDGLHPNESGQPLLLATVWPVLQPLLMRISHSASATHTPAPGRAAAAHT